MPVVRGVVAAGSRTAAAAARPLKFGTLNQNSAEIRALGLFPAGKSFSELCGPTALANVGSALAAQAGKSTKPLEDLQWMVSHARSKLGFDPVQSGIPRTHQLGTLAEAYFAKLGLKVKTTVKGAEATAAAVNTKAKRTPITLADVTPRENEAVILNYETFRTGSLHDAPARAKALTAPDASNWVRGHFVIVKSVKPQADGSFLLAVADPRGQMKEHRIFPTEFPGVFPGTGKSFELGASGPRGQFATFPTELGPNHASIVTNVLRLKLLTPAA